MIIASVNQFPHVPRVDKVAHRKLVGQCGLQPLGIQHKVVVQESRVGVEQFHLLSSGLHDIRVTVAHWGMEERMHTGI